METPAATPAATPLPAETIRSRILDLTDIFLSVLKQQNIPFQTKMMLSGAAPLLKLSIQNESLPKLTRFLNSLVVIGQAVSDLDSCPADYEAKIEPALLELVDLFKEA